MAVGPGRGLHRGGRWVRATVEALVTRDGSRCRRCQRYVNAELPGSHPRGPSIGHVIPLSRGGTDHMSNLSLEHLRCNLAAGDRDAPAIEPSERATIAAPIEVD